MTERDNSDFDFFAWRDRMRGYAEDRIPTDVKIQIAHNVIRTQIPNSKDEDATLYFDPTFQPNANELEKSLRYVAIERELKNVFDGDINKEEQVLRSKRHHDEILKILNANFTQEEILDFCMGIELKDIVLDASSALWILGSESLWGRRLRNSYLPGMVTLLSFDEETGKGEDVTHVLFDNETDAVDSINKLFGKE